MNNIDKEVRTLPPFKRLCITIGELPTSYVESMTYYESLLWFTKYLHDTVIPAINENAEAVKELQTKYIELKDYVDNYFENLDVQEEINNKLDEMAEQGELATLIALYLQMGSVLAYDTKSALKGAENVAEGTIAKTIGDLSYNDGKGNFYKIRELEEGDVIDDDLLLALSEYPTLVAEKLPDYRMNEAESDISTINSSISTINDRIDLITDRKILFIGDSYLEMYNGTSGIIDKFKSISGITNVIYSVYSGTGFSYTVDNRNFITLLNDVSDDNEVTDIIVVGGYNDQYSNQGDVLTNIGTFCSAAKTKFPNAKVYIGMAGFTLESSKRYSLFNTYQTYAKCNKYGAIYLNGVECVMHDTKLFIGGSDLTHPNESGREQLAIAVYQAWKSGYYSFNVGYGVIPTTDSGDVTSSNFEISGMIIDNKTYIVNQTNRSFYFNNHPSYSDIHVVDIEIGELTLNQNGSIFSPWAYNMYPIPVTCVVQDADSYRTMNGKIQFMNDKIYLKIEDVENDNWTDINGLIFIEINSFQASFPTQMC